MCGPCQRHAKGMPPGSVGGDAFSSDAGGINGGKCGVSTGSVSQSGSIRGGSNFPLSEVLAAGWFPLSPAPDCDGKLPLCHIPSS